MANQSTILKAYIEDRRARNFAGYQYEDLGYLIRHFPLRGNQKGWVQFACIPESKLDQTIKDQIDFFADKKVPFEWKVHNFDQPKILADRLVAHGFVADEEEHLMVYESTSEPEILPLKLPDPIIIEKVRGKKEFSAICKFQENIWQTNLSDLFEYIIDHESIFSFYIAKAHGEIIGSGWTEFLEGSDFPELHGGAVAPQWRGKGIYTALLAERIQESKLKGYPYISVDAAPMSYPILKAKGFTSLATSRPFHLQL